MAENEDVILVVEDQKICSTRSSLALHSEYFRAMFESNMTERSAKEIELKEVQATPVATLVTNVHNNKINLPEDHYELVELLSAASMLQFGETILSCRDQLLSTLKAANCLSTMYTADSCGLTHLHKCAERYSLWYFNEVVEGSEFFLLPFKSMKDYVSKSTINTSSELNILKAILHWVTHNTDTSIADLIIFIVKVVHFHQFSKSELENALVLDGINKLSDVKQQLKEILKQRKNTSSTTEKDLQDCSASRKVPRSLWLIGGELLGKTERQVHPYVQEYCTDTRTLTKVTQLQASYHNAWGYGSCAMDHYVYVLGGETSMGGIHRRSWLQDVHRYNVLTCNWEVVGRLPQPRRHHCVLNVGQHIYLLGGFGRHRIVQDTVDRLDTRLGSWEVVPSLNRAVYSAASCEVRGDLYVIKHEVEVLTQGSNTWTILVVPLPFEIHIRCALPINGDIYVLGTYIKKLYRLDPNEKKIEDLGCFKDAEGVGCLHNDRIYSFLGEMSECVEYYDLKTKEFVMDSKLDFCLYQHNVLSVPKF